MNMQFNLNEVKKKKENLIRCIRLRDHSKYISNNNNNNLGQKTRPYINQQKK